MSRPTEQEWAEALAEAMWRREYRVAPDLAHEPVEVRDGFADDATAVLAEIAPLIDRERGRYERLLADVEVFAESLVEQGEEHVRGCQGQADCAACVHHDLRAILARHERPEGETGGCSHSPAPAPQARPSARDVERVLAEVLAAHRFSPTRSQDGTLDYGWCAGGDSWGTKHVSEHEAHVAAEQAAALTALPTEDEALAGLVEKARKWVECADASPRYRTFNGAWMHTTILRRLAALTIPSAQDPSKCPRPDCGQPS